MPVMMTRGELSGTHKTQLMSDTIHALVVLVVVLCTTSLAIFAPHVVPGDVIGTVYGGAIGYAAGRAGNVVRSAPNGRREDDGT